MEGGLWFFKVGALCCLLAGLTSNAATFTWDGLGANDNWNTGPNWVGNTAPTAGADIVFAGTKRTTVAVSSWGTAVNALTFASGAGAFSLNNQQIVTGAGGITNHSTKTQTINSRIGLSDHQTWNAASGAIISTDSDFDAGNKNLTLSGSAAITIGGQVRNVGTLTLLDSGNRNFTSTSSFSATTVNIDNTGTNTFAGQVNATTVNLSAGTTNFTQTGTSAQIGSGGINISGTANASFYGNVGSNGGITISSSGNVELAGKITSAALILNGSGTTTLSGHGANNISSTTVNSGTLVLAQTGQGDAINGPLIVNRGTVVFENDDQLPHWQNVTLNDGSTLLLGDTIQKFTDLIVNGDSVIDFGAGGSKLDITKLKLTGDSVLTIVNWNDSMDSFFANYDPGSSSLAKVVFEGYGDAVWDPFGGGGFITPGAPVPEPSTYGALLMTGLLGAIGTRRRRRR